MVRDNGEVGKELTVIAHFIPADVEAEVDADKKKWVGVTTSSKVLLKSTPPPIPKPPSTPKLKWIYESYNSSALDDISWYEEGKCIPDAKIIECKVDEEEEIDIEIFY